MIHPIRLFRSISHALRGIALALRTEHSFRVQVCLAILVVAAAGWLGVRATEWIVLLLVIGAVLVLELMNTVLERMMDTFKPRLHPVIHDMKDIMAGVVLLASLAGAAIGGVIFWPYFVSLF